MECTAPELEGRAGRGRKARGPEGNDEVRTETRSESCVGTEIVMTFAGRRRLTHDPAGLGVLTADSGSCSVPRLRPQANGLTPLNFSFLKEEYNG